MLPSTALQASAEPLAGTGSVDAACPAAAGVVVTCGVAYAGDANPFHTLDIYRPVGIAKAPVVLMIHGGGWSQGNSAGAAQEAMYFAQHGLAAVSINYTLATRTQPSWPGVFDEVDQSAAWVRAHGAEYGVDGTTMGALGTSAGGHLAALLATDGSSPIVATVSLSGPMDLTASQGEHVGPVRGLLGCAPVDCMPTATDASPAATIDERAGPVLLFNSAAEEAVPVAQARTMAAALTDAAVPHQLVVLPGSLHARAYECSSAVVDGKRQLVIDASFSYLADRLVGESVLTASGYC